MRVECASAWLVALCGWAAGAVPRGPAGELRLFAAAAYDLETTVLLNDVARKDKEVGYKILATLDVAPVWSLQHQEFLLRFQLRYPKLHLRGKHKLAEFMPYESVWDSVTDSTFYAHWKSGYIRNTYLDPNELPDIINYKKSVASLFQFQVLDGEYNETDVSGQCAVLYETVSMNVFRKIKRSCAADEAGAVSSARRVARYTLSAGLDALDALYADELVALGHDSLGVKARAFTRLKRRPAAAPAPAPAPAPAADLPAALRSLPAALQPMPLALTLVEGDDDEETIDDEELVRAVAAMGAALEAGGEAAAGAEELLRVLAELRAAPRPRLAALLARDDLHPHLETLCRALGLAGTRAAHGAVAEFVSLASRDPLLSLALAYLDALALAHRPDEWVVREALRLGDEARAPPVADAALLAAAAAAARLHRAEPDAAADLAQTVRDTLARSLARCKDERCRAVRLTALGNLRRVDTADLLLQHAERGAGGEPGPEPGPGAGSASEPRAAVAALQALRAAPPAALTFARLDRLAALALQPRASLDARGAALDLLVLRRASLPAPLAHVARGLHAAGPHARHAHELRRILWQRMAALAPHHDELRRLPSMLEPELRGWDAQAHAGTSSVLVRHTGWEAGGWGAELESVQLASGGLLRRGAVTLSAVPADAPRDSAQELLAVDVWTRGLDAFAGGAEASADADGDDGSSPAEEAAGGLALSVAGARMRDISLFDGQAELLGHVWSGTASTPTSVLRALRPLSAERAAVPLLGGVHVHARVGAALALALDASAQVSLWQRTARAELELRAGAALDVRASLHTAWGRAGAAGAGRGAARLHIGADLDFYSNVSLCVRARSSGAARRRAVTLRSQFGARRLRVQRRRAEVTSQAGRTLALGRHNDATCRTLRAPDDV